LHLFDLDEHFASERVRLAHLANKCNDNDIEYMCREAGVILGITKELEEQSRSGKHLLGYEMYALAFGVCVRRTIMADVCAGSC
jgi:intraflagellar transport protein 52